MASSHPGMVVGQAIWPDIEMLSRNLLNGEERV
jgi:hypothetical protein